jgi:hypothetical protein
MKKMMLTLAIALSTLGVFAGTGEEVNPKVLKAFTNEFTTAGEVTWTKQDNYYKAAFTYNGNHVVAFYSTEAELLGLTRYVALQDLPINLQTDIRKNYNSYWITDLFEVAKSDGTAYYITLENVDTKLVLKSSGGANWTNHLKSKKA